MYFVVICPVEPIDIDSTVKARHKYTVHMCDSYNYACVYSLAH